MPGGSLKLMQELLRFSADPWGEPREGTGFAPTGTLGWEARTQVPACQVLRYGSQTGLC